MIEMTRLEFFSEVDILRALSAPDGLQQLETIHASSPQPQNFKLLLGYRLVVENVLYSLLDKIIVCPATLRLDADERLFRWWQRSEIAEGQKTADGFSVALRNNPSQVHQIAGHINGVLKEVASCPPHWKEFKRSLHSASRLARNILWIAENCCNVTTVNSKSDGSTVDSVRQTIRAGGLEYLHDLHLDGIQKLMHAYYYTHPQELDWQIGSILDDYELSEMPTSSHVVGKRPVPKFQDRSLWILGLNAAFTMAVRGLGFQLQASTDGSEELLPAQVLFGSAVTEWEKGNYFSLEYGLGLEDDVPEQFLRPISYPVFPTSYSQHSWQLERLTDRLGHSASLEGNGGSIDALHFATIITGLASLTPTDRKIEVLEIEHSASLNRDAPLSLAIRIGPSESWKVFYRIGIGRAVKPEVQRVLEQYKDRICTERIPNIDTQDLLDLCDSQPFRYVFPQWKKEITINRKLQGAIPELLASLYLINSGYDPVRVSMTPMDDVELDAVGVKLTDAGHEFFVIEVKGRSDSQNDLIGEMKAFDQKLIELRKHHELLAQVLDCSTSIRQISGLFISMARLSDILSFSVANAERQLGPFDLNRPIEELRHFIDNETDVDFWDYDRYALELRNAGISPRLIELLKYVNLVWDMPDVEMRDLPNIQDMIDRIGV